jgi:hypothetical protein
MISTFFWAVSLLAALFSPEPAAPEATTTVLAVRGAMPALATDETGTIHLVYAAGDSLLYATSRDGGRHFSPAELVGRLPNLMAFAKRGPHVAAASGQVVISANDKRGNVFAFSRNIGEKTWSGPAPITDQPEVNLEGFQTVAAAGNSVFHAFWLDLRGVRHNKIYGSKSTDGGRTWSKNVLVYASPEGPICSCCQVSALARGREVLVMFRNSLAGARDLYVVRSTDGGASFAPAQKLGRGTWKLEACPMDGGGLAFSGKTNQPEAVWRREGTVFTSSLTGPETPVAPGTDCVIAPDPNGVALAWQQSGTLYVQRPGEAPQAAGAGKLPVLAASGRSLLCAWEKDGAVLGRVIGD